MNTSTSSVSVRTVLAVVLALVVAACSGDADAGGGDADAGGSAAVEISDNSYQPASVEISAGDSVTWTNTDDVPHTVTFSDGDVESSDELAPGEEFTATFPEAGTYAYVCTLHPGMEATVTVTG